MQRQEPPKLASWLLNNFGCSPNNAAVIGDLDERFQAGRSVGWYWRHSFTILLNVAKGPGLPEEGSRHQKYFDR
jgi:hypothetical protein